MSFSVTKMAPVLVVPSEPTPTGNLPLSFMDRAPALRFLVDAFFVFEHGNEPAKVVREALADALVPYYPMAGRFVTDNTDDGEMQVACTGEGVWFVEAKADCSLKDVDFLDHQPLMIPKEQLIPYPPSESDQNTVLFMIQVTEFKCGGFTVVFTGSHVITDAIGAGEFIKAIGEKARGFAKLTSGPIWCRDAIPKPPNLKHAIQLTQNMQTSEFVHYTIDIPQDTISQLQKDFLQETGQRCSGFDVMTAKLWQCRTRAIGLPLDSDVTLSFPANIRHELLRNEIPSEGIYYGNCTFPLVIKAPSAKIANGTLAEIVELIREVKSTLPAKCARFMKGETDEDDDLMTLTYGTTNLTDIRRVAYYETDLGWGLPKNVIPLIDNPINLSLYLNPPAPMKGIRLKTHCVIKEHLKAFQDELKKL